MAEEPGQVNRDASSNEYKLSRRRLIGFAIFGAILVIVFLWVWVNPSDPTEKKDFIQAVGVLLAALAGLGGLYFTRASTKEQLEQARENTEKQLRQARESQERTQRLTEQGQITERFTRAIEQLGATDDKGKKKLEIRLGGIYALERIDKESPERAYHSTVMEVLTAYVRENSRWEHEEPSTPTSAPNAAERDNDVGQDDEPTLRDLPTDVRAILDVLRRREEDSVSEEHQILLDLRGANLYRADLQDANLQEANLIGAILQKADLEQANLRGAILHKAHLKEAILQGANLYRADLHRANLQEANLIGANLRGANLYSANLQDANLRGANLRGANLIGANLWGARLVEANLQAADLQKARHLTQDQIEWVTGSNETELPEDLNRPDLWSASIEEQEKILRERERMFGPE